MMSINVYSQRELNAVDGQHPIAQLIVGEELAARSIEGWHENLDDQPQQDAKDCADALFITSIQWKLSKQVGNLPEDLLVQEAEIISSGSFSAMPSPCAQISAWHRRDEKSSVAHNHRSAKDV